MWLIARPLDWLLCRSKMAAIDARLDAERDRIDAIAARRLFEWERRHQALTFEYEGVSGVAHLQIEYHKRLRAEHDRYMSERNEEHRWRTEAHKSWCAESRQHSHKADRNVIGFIWAVAIATWFEAVAIAVWT